MKILKKIREFKKTLSPYRPSIEVLISRQSLLYNLNEFKRQYPSLKFAPVLKSNAYGHGLVEVAKILAKEEIAFLVLDSMYEAIVLRNEGLKSGILVVGYTQAENIKTSRLTGVAYTVTSIEQLRDITALIDSAVKIHLKIDTGMHRQGILPTQIAEAMSIIKANRLIILEGICSHFADADGPDDVFTKHQIELWKKISEDFQNNFPSVKYIHISASAGTFYSRFTPGNVARLGLSLYGIKANSRADLNLKPVMQIESLISSVKKIPAGEGVGYNLTFTTARDSLIATVPMGYFEGVDRRLSNAGHFKIKDRFCPIVGRISMNITSVNVTDMPDVALGEKVVVMSRNRDDLNSVENIARLAQTISYEILVHIPQSLRRITID